MRAPQFSLKRLFVSALLVGVGTAIAARMFWLEYQPVNRVPIERMLPLFLASGPMIGAGLLCPFKRTGIGVGIGLLLQAALFAAFVGIGFRDG